MKPTKGTIPTFVRVRSILSGNVARMLEHVSTIKNNTSSDNLFGDIHDDRFQFDTTVPIQAEFDVLLQERNSLGLFVSADPLARYRTVLDWVREVTGAEDIHLIFVDKIRKIFTRSHTMMLALSVISADSKQYEAIVFPKSAGHVSQILTEKKLFFVRGRISEPKKRSGESTEEAHYESLPKIMIEHASPFADGVVALFSHEEVKLPKKRIQVLESKDWKTIETHPELLNATGETQYTKESNTAIKKVTIPASTPIEILKKIKTLLHPTPGVGRQLIELYMEKDGQIRKVKGKHYGNSDEIAKYL